MGEGTWDAVLTSEELRLIRRVRLVSEEHRLVVLQTVLSLVDWVEFRAVATDRDMSSKRETMA